MQEHRLGPLQHLERKHYAEVNRLAWQLRKITGHGQLRLALLMSVSEALRPEVEAKVLEIQAKHRKVQP